MSSCRMFSSIPGLYSLDGSNIPAPPHPHCCSWQSKMPLGESLVENFCPRLCMAWGTNRRNFWVEQGRKQHFCFFFNWGIISLQYCVGFSHTSTWISHRYTYGIRKHSHRYTYGIHKYSHKYTYPLPLEPPSHLLPYPIPLSCRRVLVWAPWVIEQITTAIYFTRGNICISTLLSQFIPLSPSLTVSRSLFSLSASPLLPCK